MKKYALIFILLTFFIVGNSYATDWHKADSKVIGWESPAMLYDGSPLPSGIQGWVYEVWTKDVNGSNITSAGTVNTEGATVTITEGSKKYIGISAAYIDIDGIQSEYSDIAWSDNAIDCLNGVTFGIHNLKRPDKPFDMHP